MWGQDVEVAYDGEEALAKSEVFRPHVILLDLGLPGMNGFEVAVRLRERSYAGETLLIAMTGWGQQEDIRRSKESGFAHHLVKPVDLAALRDLLIGVPVASSEVGEAAENRCD